MPQYDIAELERLVDGQLSWPRVQEIMKDAKDSDRFEKWLQILQKRVSFNEPILLPLTPSLFIVQKGGERVVKCRCGHDFGDYCVNWKLSASIYVRESDEAFEEIYHGREKPDPAWVQIREYYCPGCSAQLEVEAMPRGAPPDFEFLPDLDAFYREWLGRPLPGRQEFVDKTPETIAQWSA